MLNAHSLCERRGHVAGERACASCLIALFAVALLAVAFLPYDEVVGRLWCMRFSVGFGSPLHSCGL